MRAISICALLAVCLVSSSLGATASFSAELETTPNWSPVQVALATPIQVVPRAWDVKGLRLNAIYCENHDVGFLDVGLVNHTTGDQTGIQVAGIMNRVAGSVSGIQVSGIANSVGGNGMVEGLQIACMNTVGDASGLQVGIVNHARTIEGMQIGLVNLTSELNGMQIGLVNWNDHGSVRFLPILNVGF